MEHICLIAIYCDAKLKFLEKRAIELYSPETTICYVRISDRIPVSRRAVFLEKLQNVFIGVEMDVQAVSDYQIHLIDALNSWCERHHKGADA